MSAKEYAWKQVHMLRASARPDCVIVNAWGREFRIVPTERQIRDVAARNRLSDVTVEFVYRRFSLDAAPTLDQVCSLAVTDSNGAASEGAGAASRVVDRVDKSDDEMSLVVPDDDITSAAQAPTSRAWRARRGA
jgi:hypothetical protein